MRGNFLGGQPLCNQPKDLYLPWCEQLKMLGTGERSFGGRMTVQVRPRRIRQGGLIAPHYLHGFFECRARGNHAPPLLRAIDQGSIKSGSRLRQFV